MKKELIELARELRQAKLKGIENNTISILGKNDYIFIHYIPEKENMFEIYDSDTAFFNLYFLNSYDTIDKVINYLTDLIK